MINNRTENNKQDLNVKTFEILVKQYHKRMIAYALSIVHYEDVAKDLVQDAFVTAYKNLQKFDTSRDFGKWLRGIIRKKYLEWIYRQKREITPGEEIMDTIDQQYSAWDNAIEDGKEDVFVALHNCLDKIEDTARKIIDLFYIEKQPCSQISVLFNMTEVVIRKRLQRIRENLADCIQYKLGFTYIKETGEK